MKFSKHHNYPSKMIARVSRVERAYLCRHRSMSQKCHIAQMSQYYYHWNRHDLAVILIVKLWCLMNVTFVTPFNRHNITIIGIVTIWRLF